MSITKTLLIRLIVVLTLFFLSTSVVRAAFSLSVESVDSSVVTDKDQEVLVNLNITDLPSESYFRVAFQKESGGSYFGYVQNNSGGWALIDSLSADCTNYYKVSDTTTTSLSLMLKVGSDDVDSGSYVVRAHRFTGSCSSNSASDNSVVVELSLPTPTPTPTAEPTPTPTAIPTSTPKATATVKPTVKPKKATPRPTSRIVKNEGEDELIETVLGAREDLYEEDKDGTGDKMDGESRSFPLMAVFFILGGVVFIGLAVYPFVKDRLPKLKNKNESKSSNDQII